MSITSDDAGEMEEERRLAYVGITRAREDLTICCARQRMIRGETQYNPVSRFVKEIPESLLDNRPPVPNYVSSEVTYMPKYGYNKPVASLRPNITAAENKPYIANAGSTGTASFGAMGIVKGGSAVAGERPDYDAGDRVQHIKYGMGTVIAMEPGPRDYKVTVDFDDAGQKIMYAAFAKLKKV